MIKIYTMEECSMCKELYIELIRRGIEVKEISLNKNPDKFQELIEEGFTVIPITEKDGNFIEGFEPDLIEEIFA